MTDLNSTAPCERCGSDYPITRNKDGTPRKRKHEGFCRKCVHYLSDAKWGALGTKKCVSCGDEFTLMEVSQKTCSHSCRTVWVGFLALVNQEPRVCARCGSQFYIHRGSKAERCTPCYGRSRHVQKLLELGKEPFSAKEKVCAHCDSPFLRDVPGKTYCSPKCKHAAKYARKRETEIFYESRRARDSKRRALKRTTQVERIIPREVFERDGYICHLCGEITDKDTGNAFGRKNPLAPELEHIVALSAGGTHTWSNVACSCRACNSRKGAASFGQLHLDYGPKRLWPELATPNQPARPTAC